tara:strand:- start:317 stop:466 length:150 start_codon:yes stop_codon:yes gene_type:complete
MNELIKKYEIMAKTLLDVINHPETDQEQLDRTMACRRFVVGMLNDLKKF